MEAQTPPIAPLFGGTPVIPPDFNPITPHLSTDLPPVPPMERFGPQHCEYCGLFSYKMYRCVLLGVADTWVCFDCNTWYVNN